MQFETLINIHKLSDNAIEAIRFYIFRTSFPRVIPRPSLPSVVQKPSLPSTVQMSSPSPKVEKSLSLPLERKHRENLYTNFNLYG